MKKFLKKLWNKRKTLRGTTKEIDGLQQNQEFFSMLLNNESLKKEVLGIFIKSIYEDLKKDE